MTRQSLIAIIVKQLSAHKFQCANFCAQASADKPQCTNLSIASFSVRISMRKPQCANSVCRLQYANFCAQASAHKFDCHKARNFHCSEISAVVPMKSKKIMPIIYRDYCRCKRKGFDLLQMKGFFYESEGIKRNQKAFSP